MGSLPNLLLSDLFHYLPGSENKLGHCGLANFMMKSLPIEKGLGLSANQFQFREGILKSNILLTCSVDFKLGNNKARQSDPR